MNETIVVLGCVLVCFIVVAAPIPPSEAIDPSGTRASATRRAELRLAGTILAGTAFACLALLAVSRGAPEIVLPLLGILVLVSLVLHPWILVRFSCVPFGLPIWAHRLSRLGGHPWVRDPEGGACLAGALACLRRGRRSSAARAMLLERLERTSSQPLRGAGIVAAALLAAEAGEPARARRLLESLDLLDPDACPPVSRDVARDWLVADAARAGDWLRVLDLSASLAYPTPMMRFFHLAARVMLGHPVTRSTILATWMRAPRRIATWSITRQLLSSSSPRAALEAAGRGDGNLLETKIDDDLQTLAANAGRCFHQRAFALHLEAATLDPVARETLECVAHGWDATLWDLEFRRHLRARIRALGGRRSPEATALELRRIVAQDLAHWWCTSGSTSWPPRSGVLDVAREVVIRNQARQLASRVQTLSRCAPKSPLAIWEAWLELRACHATLVALCGPDRLRAFYGAFDEVVSRLVLELHARAQRPLAHAISLWLLEEAERIEDRMAAAHHRMSVALGP